MDPAAAKPSLTEALDQLWAKFLPEIDQRVAVLTAAAASLAAEPLSLDAQRAAESAAHKLAGVLGTFGLAEGSILAAEAETLCSAKPALEPAYATRLADIAARLRAIVANRT
jgi:HPt (histidine-containing phosphotransfer) domain-containing protein